MSNYILILSLILFEMGVMTSIFYSISKALIVFAISTIIYCSWLRLGEINEYIKSPHAHKSNWCLFRRSCRIKFATTILIISFITFQSDFGFDMSTKQSTYDFSGSLTSGIAIIIVAVFLWRDLIANKKKS